MAEGSSPLLPRRRLRAELRKARQERGLTQEQVASEMRWSLSKIIRIEGASTGISHNDLTALLNLYQVTDPEQVELLVGLAEAARKRSPWGAYRDVAPQSLLQLIEYESVASAVRQFETMFIPGILQTGDYARAVIENYYYDERPGSHRLRALVELRLRREALFGSENPPSFHFMLDEAVARRQVGGASVMKLQLRHLLEVAQKPNITLELIPFSAGFNPGMRSPFEIIEFADPSESDIVFLESRRGDIVSDDPGETLSYREAFEELGKASLGPRDSLTRLARIADEMLLLPGGPARKDRDSCTPVLEERSMADWDETGLAWRKSTRSNSGGCVEMALGDQVVLLRDSKRPEGTVLAVSLLAWTALVARVRNLADMTS
jgi:transcriptional regulator with XRE-family HTH domain